MFWVGLERLAEGLAVSLEHRFPGEPVGPSHGFSAADTHRGASIRGVRVPCTYVAVKVHRTSPRVRVLGPIIKMHARYVTTFCTYARKYYPAPVAVRSNDAKHTWAPHTKLHTRPDANPYTRCPRSNCPQLGCAGYRWLREREN